MKEVLIVGYGNIGRHIESELKSGCNISIYDKYKEGYEIDKVRNKFFDYVFICVPTEMNADGSCNMTCVYDSIGVIKNSVGYDTLVIKSTIPVGATEKICEITKEVYVFSPEYYGTTIHAPESLDFLVLAGPKEYTSKVAELYYSIKNKNLRITFTDYRTAELAKYMENCFLATKVAFCAEFSLIAKEFGVSYPELREIFVLDERMGDSHTFINPDQPYYDSHCLNKDIPGLISQSSESLLMKAVNDINNKRKKK